MSIASSVPKMLLIPYNYLSKHFTIARLMTSGAGYRRVKYGSSLIAPIIDTEPFILYHSNGGSLDRSQAGSVDG
jgi:hypothetical protein